MTRDKDDHANNDNELAHGFDSKPASKPPRQEPTFSQFDEDEDYEEPDRDADYASGYHSDDVEEDADYEDDFVEDDEPDLFGEEDSEAKYDDDQDAEDEDESDTWLEKEGYPEEGEGSDQKWPWSLIAVAIVALVLLVAGGYGVMQQRAATEAELRELRAALANTPSSPEDVGAHRDALEQLQLAYDKLATEAQALRLESRTLADMISGLEAQLGKQQSVPDTSSVAGKAEQVKPTSATPKPAQPVVAQSTAPAATVPKPAVTKPAATASSGPWFVNFGSYAKRNVAESWATRLHPGAGKVIIIPNTSDGRSLYRLRVIGLADRESAKQVAHKMETE